MHPNQLLDEWKGRSIDTTKMAMQVEPRWAVWVEYQRNQSQMELFRFEYFRFSEICVRPIEHKKDPYEYHEYLLEINEFLNGDFGFFLVTSNATRQCHFCGGLVSSRFSKFSLPLIKWPVDLRSVSWNFLSCPEVGQTEPPPALAFSSAGEHKRSSTLHRAPVGQGPVGSWLAGHCPWALGPWVLVWTGACYWHGVGGFMFNSPSSPAGECNPGFQAGRTTANAILPV